MKVAITLLMVLLVTPNNRTDTINHYLPEKNVTAKKLVENGFYRYSYVEEIGDEDDFENSSPKSFIKYDMYSNVGPEKNKKGILRPMKLARFGNNDTVQTKKSNTYLRDKLNYRTITYVFRDNILFYKNVNVLYIDNTREDIADLTTEEKILQYYSSLKIPIRTIIDNEYSTKTYPTLFMIDSYKTTINYNYQGYDMLTNYSKEKMPDWNIMEYWYSKSKFINPPPTEVFQ